MIRLDPAREAAWRHLGYKRQGNRWVKPEELAAEKQESARQKQAEKHWRTKLEKLRGDLVSKDKAKRAHAEQALAEVTDPHAVPVSGRLRARQRAAAGRGGADARADRRSVGIARAGRVRDLFTLAGGAEARHRNAGTARSARRRRAADRARPPALQVSGTSGERPRVARRTLCRRRAVQHPAIL